MNSARVALVASGVVVAVLAVLFLVLEWDDANKIATSVSALAGVAAVGVAVWAAWPVVAEGRSGVRVSRTGKATAGPGGGRTQGSRRVVRYRMASGWIARAMLRAGMPIAGWSRVDESTLVGLGSSVGERVGW